MRSVIEKTDGPCEETSAGGPMERVDEVRHYFIEGELLQSPLG